MAERIRLGLVFGGRSGEHEVSLMSTRSVLNALDPDRYIITQIAITKEGRWFSGPHALTALETGNMNGLTPVVLRAEPGHAALYALDGVVSPLASMDVIFPVLHGSYGEDGAIQGLFELADVAYVGAGVLASAVGMDKSLFKDVMRANGLPVTAWLTLSRAELTRHMDESLARCEALAEYPLFVKPANLGSSVGISKVRNRSDLYMGLTEAARFDRRVTVEAAVPNPREFEVSVLGNNEVLASVAGEIIPGDDYYSYNAKYFSDTSQLCIPAQLDETASRTMRDLAISAYKAIDCAGMGRVDFLMNGATGEIFINELNTIPGYTAISMYPKLWEASGLSYRDLVDRLIELAFERKAERDATERSYQRGP